MNDSLWYRLFRGTCHHWERADWQSFAGRDWLDRIMEVAVTDRFHAKQGRSTGRWILQADGRRLGVYLKRHYGLPWLHGVLAALWPGRGWSPALQEQRHLEWARDQELPVPAVVAAGEFIGPWGRFQSFLAVEELADMLPLHEAVPLANARLDAATFRQWKRGLVAEMARLTRILHDRRRFHKDLYLCHFYIAREDTGRIPAWHGRVHLIDLHRLRHHPCTWRLWQAKDLAELLYSSDMPDIDVWDRLAFWRAYLGPGRPSWAEPWLRRCIRFKWWRYRHHSAARRVRRAA